MNRIAILAISLILHAGHAPSVCAFDFGFGLFKKKPKSDPPSRIKQLIATLQTDQDEKARLSAAEELRSFDTRMNPEMIPALIGSLQRDPSAAVRSEAAETLGRLKPVDQATGLILETVQEADPAATVREAAKAALWQYHLNGYRSMTSIADGRPQTAEPPLASRKQPLSNVPKYSDAGFRPITNGVGKSTTYQPTAEPPLAKTQGSAKAESFGTSAQSQSSLPPIPNPAGPFTTYPAAMPNHVNKVPEFTPTPSFVLPPSSTSLPPLPTRSENR